MQEQFESALQGLLNFKGEGDDAAARYNDLFKQMITASMQICGEADYDVFVSERAADIEKKYGAKIEYSDDATDAYRKLREQLRFEMLHESMRSGRDQEVCCTDSNYRNALAKFRGELEKIVPNSQVEVLESMSYSLFSDFTKFFVGTTFDMIADAKIYRMKEYRPLQLNAMGKELRTYVKSVREQDGKPQKSETVSSWFTTMMLLPAFLFRKLYGVSFVEMFGLAQKQVDDVAHLFNAFQRDFEQFVPGDEYWILKEFMNGMNLADCLTVCAKAPKGHETPNGPEAAFGTRTESAPKKPIVN